MNCFTDDMDGDDEKDANLKEKDGASYTKEWVSLKSSSTQKLQGTNFSRSNRIFSLTIF